MIFNRQSQSNNIQTSLGLYIYAFLHKTFRDDTTVELPYTTAI